MEYKWGLQKIGYQLTANGGGGVGHKNVTEL